MLESLSIQDNSIPIYIQLRDQILALIGRGTLKPGTQMPTMRQVAVALKIDLNTVQRAYAELERDGVLSKQRGVGSFVTDTVPPSRNTKKQVQDFAARRRPGRSRASRWRTGGGRLRTGRDDRPFLVTLLFGAASRCQARHKMLARLASAASQHPVGRPRKRPFASASTHRQQVPKRRFT
jgi:GntR family transcriptional regulator